jgi:hypothetical protein
MIPLMHLLAKLNDCSNNGVDVSGPGWVVTSFKKRAPSGSESRKGKKLRVSYWCLEPVFTGKGVSSMDLEFEMYVIYMVLLIYCTCI